MPFASLTFLFLFLPICLILCYLVPLRVKNGVLLGLSLFFCLWGQSPLALLPLLAGTAASYGAGLLLDRWKGIQRTLLFWGTIAAEALLLAICRYSGMFFSGADWLPPLGIAVATLHHISYLTDVYRGSCRPQFSIAAYGTYALMFPKLLSGPITRYERTAKELEHRFFRGEQVTDGILRFTTGLAKKVLLADNIGALWRQVSLIPRPGLLPAWLGLLAFGLALYYNLSGYADMAIGLGRMLGFTLPENFAHPFSATSIRDFCRRWQMSLLSWIRCYLLDPLQHGPASRWRTAFYALLIWMLVGIWYGGEWHYLLWGAYTGLLLAGETLVWGKLWTKFPLFLRRLLTLALTAGGWIFLAAGNLGDILSLIKELVGRHGFGLQSGIRLLSSYGIMLLMGIIGAGSLPGRLIKQLQKKPRLLSWLTPGFVLILLVLSTAYLVGGTDPQLLFRF